ncbi:MAG: flagellar basal body P-ring protein FlgI [Planctomycetota bacterium]|nr:flagellar basal body P-ring protein FlgI [Planctomycetota bacterium]
MLKSTSTQASRHLRKLVAGVAVLLCWAACAESCFGQYLRIRDICRVKGQEENTLHGLGLVVGLKGTGDGDVPTTRALAKMMALMGNPLSQGASGAVSLDELKNAKNVAMVFVTATVPAEGARQGEMLDIVVNAISAKSIEGGYLMMTPLLGPRPGNPRIYGYGQGAISLDDTGPPTSAKVHNGCRLEESFHNAFLKDETFTLVLDKNHASFRTAFDIEDLLNNPSSFGTGGSATTSSNGNIVVGTNDAKPIAKAIDQVNIEVGIRDIYRDNPVAFIAEVLDTQIVPPKHDACVVIDERNGSIVIGDNVLVGRVAVAHRNLSIETGNEPATGPFLEIDQSSDTSTTRLKALVAALNSLKVSPDDIMDIIKSLEKGRHLYGRLIVQ